MDEDTQTLECRFNGMTGGYWRPFTVACEPLTCRYRPPSASTDSIREIIYSPNTTTHQQYETMATYTCPKNRSMLPIIEDEWSFDYSDSAGIIQELNATCTLEGTWQIDGGVIGETCTGTAGNPIEDCDRPKIPKCVDKNKYCTDPPPIPKFAKRNDINVAAPGYKTHPGTVYYYYCPLSNWAFDYTYDESQPSYFFTNNVNNMTITCDPEGFWKVDFPMEGETCINKQPNGTCESVFIPDCVDRTVYCKNINTPGGADRTLLNQPNSNNEREYSTIINFKCPEINWFFGYSLPVPFISYAYSTNIGNTNITCNEYG